MLTGNGLGISELGDTVSCKGKTINHISVMMCVVTNALVDLRWRLIALGNFFKHTDRTSSECYIFFCVSEIVIE